MKKCGAQTGENKESSYTVFYYYIIISIKTSNFINSKQYIQFTTLH